MTFRSLISFHSYLNMLHRGAGNLACSRLSSRPTAKQAGMPAAGIIACPTVL
jgi:hypothetical protein